MEVSDSFTPLPLYPRYPLGMRLDGFQSQSRSFREETKILPISGIESQSCNQSLYRLSYPGSCVSYGSHNRQIFFSPKQHEPVDLCGGDVMCFL
jgi:hypothetical protein